MEFEKIFLLYMLVGFVAQMIDGALGMAYGVSSNTFLLSLGIPPRGGIGKRSHGRSGDNGHFRRFAFETGQRGLETRQAAAHSGRHWRGDWRVFAHFH